MQADDYTVREQIEISRRLLAEIYSLRWIYTPTIESSKKAIASSIALIRQTSALQDDAESFRL